MQKAITQALCDVAYQPMAVRIAMVTTHVGWFVAAILAYKVGNIPLVLLATGTVLFSCTFHLTGKRGFEIIDTAYAALYLCLGPALLLLAGASWREWIMGGAMVLAALAIYVISTRRRLTKNCIAYIEWHALWHVTASLLTLLIYVIYLGYWRF